MSRKQYLNIKAQCRKNQLNYVAWFQFFFDHRHNLKRFQDRMIEESKIRQKIHQGVEKSFFKKFRVILIDEPFCKYHEGRFCCSHPIKNFLYCHSHLKKIEILKTYLDHFLIHDVSIIVLEYAMREKPLLTPNLNDKKKDLI